MSSTASHPLVPARVLATVLLLSFPALPAYGQAGAAESADGDGEPMTIGAGEEVVVTANRQETRRLEVPANVSVLDMQQLEDDGFLVAADELRNQPGISFRRGEGDNDAFLFVNVRGVTGNHGNDTFLALLDGIPFVGADEEVLMDEIPYAAVDGIEIVRGPVSALYGRGGIGGAINYSLQTPSGRITRVDLSAGSNQYFGGDFRIGGSFGNDHSYFLSADAVDTEGWRDSNASTRFNLFGRGVFTLGNRATLSAYVNVFDRDYEFGSVIPTFADGALLDVAGGRRAFLGSRDIGKDSESVMAAFRFSRLSDAKRMFEVTGHARQRESENVLDFFDLFSTDPSSNILAVNGFDSVEDEDTAFLEATYQASTTRTRTIAGASVERTSLVESDLWTGQNGFTFECGFAFFLIEIDTTTGAILNRDHPCFVEREHQLSGDTDNTFLGAFAQTEIDLGSRATLTLGARYDDFERDTALIVGPEFAMQPEVNDSEDNVSPKVAFTFAVTPFHVLYANYGEGFSSNFGPVWQWDPSRFIRDTRPTTLTSVEIGAKGSAMNGRFGYGVSLYSIEQDDRLVFVTNPEAFVDFTVPSTIATTGQRFGSDGLEVSLDYRYRRSGRLAFRYAYVDAVWDELVLETFAGPLDLSGNRPTGVPETTLGLTWMETFGERFDVRLSWQYYGDYAITQDNAVEGGSYDLVDLGVTYRPEWTWLDRINLSVTNLLDEEYFFLFGGSRTAVTTAVPGVPAQARLTFGFAF